MKPFTLSVCSGDGGNLVFVEEVRNDLYVVLDYGDFQQGSKTAPKNVEATLEVVSESGDVLKVMHHDLLCGMFGVCQCIAYIAWYYSTVVS